MKIFDGTNVYDDDGVQECNGIPREIKDLSSFEGRVNFVDDNNVLVGYDLEQSCCEYADWFIADEPTNIIPKDKRVIDEDMEPYFFDTNYVKKFEEAFDGDSKEYDCLDEGGMVVFRLFSGKGEKYLHLFNCHNGYYGHGFSMDVGGVSIHSGGL